MEKLTKEMYRSLKGETIHNNYYLSKVLGIGGFGCVFAAQERVGDTRLRDLAVKLILNEGPEPDHHHPANTLNQSTQLRDDSPGPGDTSDVRDPSRDNQRKTQTKYQPLNELMQATQLDHSHLIRTYTAGHCQLKGKDFFYLLMEKGDCSLQDRTQKQLLSPSETRILIHHVAGGLAYLHSQGKVHRDLKPANILWVNSSWKLSDFGLVRSLDLDSKSYLKTNESYGTYAYMPPEAFDSTISPDWDIWSLGIIVVTALTGQLPYQFTDTNQLMKQVMLGNRQLPPLPRLPQDLKVLIEGCLCPNRRERWKAQQILDYLNGETVMFTPRESEPEPKKPTQVEVIARLNNQNATFEPFEFETVKLEVVSSFWKSKEIAVERQSGKRRQWVQPLLDDVTLEMVEIPPGSFLMGAPQGEEQAENDEYPQHWVSIPPFLMGKYLITQAQWRIVAQLPQIHRPLELEPSWFRGDTFPVEQISWYDSIEFCARLSHATGRDYRLPSEAEWEYACRAGTTTPFSCGHTLSTDLANYDGTSTYGLGQPGLHRKATSLVGSFPPNPFGLYDMHGNLREWCLDDWRESYLNVPNNGDPYLSHKNPPQSCDHGQGDWSQMLKGVYDKLLRGGSWHSVAKECRSAYRQWFAPQNRSSSIGFRICCSPITPSED